MPTVTRRALLVGAAAATLSAAAAPTPAAAARSWDVIVVGAGVFGTWTAHHLQAAGRRVLLVDGQGPAHARASSGGESRITRGAYGRDLVYTRMAMDSLPEWQRLSGAAGLPVFHPTGILFFFPQRDAFLDETMRVHRALGLPTELLDRRALARRFPQLDFGDVEAGLIEPGFGILMARRAVQTLVDLFVRAGGEFRRAAVLPPGDGEANAIRTADGGRLTAERIVFACGPWLGRLFPQLLGPRIFATRQEVFFFAPPPGDDRFQPTRMPGWADYNNGDIYYGMPDLESRGFKIAHDRHGPPIDPDEGDRVASPEALADVRAYMERRFPALRGRPLNEARVCQYENSSNGDLLIDFHPDRPDLLLVGAGSGHGFKHGPAVGRYAADLLLGRLDRPEPRFSLATKGVDQARAVH